MNSTGLVTYWLPLQDGTLKLLITVISTRERGRILMLYTYSEGNFQNDIFIFFKAVDDGWIAWWIVEGDSRSLSQCTVCQILLYPFIYISYILKDIYCMWVYLSNKGYEKEKYLLMPSRRFLFFKEEKGFLFACSAEICFLLLLTCPVRPWLYKSPFFGRNKSPNVVHFEIIPSSFPPTVDGRQMMEFA